MEKMTMEEALEVIRSWMHGSPFEEEGVDEYMEHAAGRALILRGVEISTDDPVEFVREMRECKMDAIFEIEYRRKEKPEKK